VAPAAPVIPPELAERIQRLTMGDVVDLALRGNPATAQAWANARAAAAAYGASKSAYYPTLDGDVSGTRIKTAATSGRVAVIQTVYGPSATLSWLLWDFGGRSGAIESARQALLAADWTHNATIADVVLQAQVAFLGEPGLDVVVVGLGLGLWRQRLRRYARLIRRLGLGRFHPVSPTHIF